MSIYIKGMEMPKDNEILCINIMANGNVYYSLDLNANPIANAFHVPPHRRLIDADALMKVLGITDMDCEKCELSDHAAFCTLGPEFTAACCAIEYAPTIIPADKED